ncbi:MAG: hypothetical protein KatS3mg076_1373 [Candidatus Binatia bacterium]|nr:MAG: hypothetical protein KatS3mg076_1373 [Candidatus Binatia bacterium]
MLRRQLAVFFVLACASSSGVLAYPTPTPRVSEKEFDLYVDVYAAMQKDRDLTIDMAVARHGMTVEEFRRLEQRIQHDPRLVDRVRKELLKHAKSVDVWVPPTPERSLP